MDLAIKMISSSLELVSSGHFLSFALSFRPGHLSHEDDKAGEDEGQCLHELGASRNRRERGSHNVGHEDARKPAIQKPDRGRKKSCEHVQHLVGSEKKRRRYFI